MPSNVEQAKDHQRLANGVVCGLAVCAIVVGAAAGWTRYSQKRECGSGDTVSEASGDRWPLDISLAAGWRTPDGLPRNAVGAPRFVCPQCQGACWTRVRSGSLVCPFCGQGMVAQGPRIVPAAGVAAAGIAAPIPIQSGVRSPHDNRGACTNCHTLVASVNSRLAPMIQAGVEILHRNRGSCTACHSVVRANGLGPVPTIQANAVAPHPERGACANCHIVARLSAAAATLAATAPNSPAAQWQGPAAPPIAADAVKPLLIKPFGVEVCPAPGGGAKVTGVMGSSFASKAGLVAGDIVIECNGKKVTDAEGLAQLILKAPAEAEAQLKIMRNDRVKKVAVMVGEGEMEGFTPIQRP